MFPIDSPLRIGRDASNDVVLPLEALSRHHAPVWATAGQIWVQDHGSTNGTFLDGRRLAEPTQVPRNGRVDLAGVAELRFTHPVAAARTLLLEVGRLRLPVSDGRTVLGPGAALQIPGLLDRAVLVVGDETSLQVEGRVIPLPIGREVQAAGQTWRLLPVRPQASTVAQDPL